MITDYSLEVAGWSNLPRFFSVKIQQKDFKPLAFTDKQDIPRYLAGKPSISKERNIAGGIIGFAGFGLGHVVQNRWVEDGMKFTLLPIDILGATISSCRPYPKNCLDRLLIGLLIGLLGFTGIRIWEIVDLWSKPTEHNNRYYLSFVPQFEPYKKGTSRKLNMSPSLAINWNL